MILDKLEKFGLSVAPFRIVKTWEEARAAAKELGYPVVVKLASDTVHKTDVGGVVLDNYNETMLKSTWDYFQRHFKGEALLVQKQIKKGIELYVGIEDDPSFGRIILFGLGGVYVEVFRDISARICPITEKDVDSMIHDLKAKKILLGYRGKQVNLALLRKTLPKICEFAEHVRAKELDINPMKVDAKHLYIIDARVTGAQSAAREEEPSKSLKGKK